MMLKSLKSDNILLFSKSIKKQLQTNQGADVFLFFSQSEKKRRKYFRIIERIPTYKFVSYLSSLIKINC